MSANSLHLDLPPDQPPGLLPWIVVLACTAILIVLISQLAQGIPSSLQQEAQRLLDTREFPNVSITADGRDLVVSGVITVDQSSNQIVSALEQIDGVLGVQDALTISDPVAQARAAAEQFTGDLADVDLAVVAFQPGSVSFLPESDNALADLLGLMQRYPGARVRIEGHTDNTGPDAVNLRVSRDRAGAVANYLVARGIRSDRIIVTGYGSTQPIDSNDTEAGRARNRRIEVSAVN